MLATMRANAQKLLFVFWQMLNVTAAGWAQIDQPVYTDSLQNGWQNYGWATLNYTNPSPFHAGSNSISVSCGPYRALYLHHAAFDTAPFTNLAFWIHGGPTGGQRLQVQVTLNGKPQLAHPLAPLSPNIWQQIVVSLATLDVDYAPNMDGFWIQEATGATIPTFFVDDIFLQAGPPPGSNPTNFINLDAAAQRHPISPRIYGLAYASSNDLADLNCPLNRLGGNNTSRYNWQVNADNRAA